MRRLIIRRLSLGIPLLLVVSLFTFVLVSLSPGDPAITIVGVGATASRIAAVRRQLGLNEPLWTQYWHWLDSALHGNLGVSLFAKQAVTALLAPRVAVTLTIVLAATLVSTILGVAMGMVSALRGGATGRSVDVVSLFGFAIPNFWLAILLVLLFAVQLRWFPATGWVPFSSSPVQWLRSLALPVVALAVHGATGVAKQTRDSLSEALSQEYVLALRAAGISERSIIFRHALRNAAIPVVTVVGLFFVGMLGGAVVIEQIFALPGLGSAAVMATNTHDLPVIEGVALYFAVIVVVVNLLVELAYGWLNPRARAR